MFICVPKAYPNSFLATLNARNSLRSRLGAPDGAIVLSEGRTSNIGSGFKFNSATHSRVNTDIANIALFNEPPVPIAIGMSNVASNNTNGDNYTKVHI
ncbi:hypothetical protein PNOK_0299000 [Pyrrhoderma noxium]|uniref:Uncharacterized protein n=1 Tax=Pyrrhoderma noxium TaxID=2282107 RepID=A0A286UL92_9AGAM|nr:hypothetical protein PNOK_0299000 [Pyrrhoderma noxium]